METGTKRTILARVAVALGFVCGLIGLLAGLTAHMWKLGVIGWFTGGGLLTLIAVYVLIDGAIALQKARATSPFKEAA
ncbi:MAG: hypothetical protein VST65_04485 [Nitrospirota bacterium]|nr:hypothetical protein [Nitrospirota bacterium]